MTTTTIPASMGADADPPRSAPVNLRDLGGTPTASGPLRSGVAIRADDLALVTPEVARDLVADGLTAIIDLRSPGEVAVTGRGPLGELAVAYHHLPLLGDVGLALDADAPLITHRAMGEMYLSIAERAAPHLATAVTLIAHAPGATAFHCAAGRDRTGVLAAMLLLALGADDEAIVADYARTGPNMPAIIERTRGSMGLVLRRLGVGPERFSRQMIEEGPMDVAMTMLLQGLRDRHGDPLTPLRDAGLSEATLERLRARALAA